MTQPFYQRLTNASANACSASVEACSIFAAITGRDAGLKGGLSQMVRDRNLPKLESLDGLVSLDASLEPAVDRGIPEDIRRGLGDSCSLPRLYMYANRELGDPERLVANLKK